MDERTAESYQVKSYERRNLAILANRIAVMAESKQFTSWTARGCMGDLKQVLDMLENKARRVSA